MKYFGIFDERRVSSIELNSSRSILVRILEPSGDRKYFIKNISNYNNVLELYLPDYVNATKKEELDEIFEKLNNFILDNDFDEVIVHCSLGISRSPAIMICIAKILDNVGLENFVKEKFRFYNRFIVDAFDRYEYNIKKIEDNKFIYAYDNLTNSNFSDKIDDVIDLKKLLCKKR